MASMKSKSFGAYSCMFFFITYLSAIINAPQDSLNASIPTQQVQDNSNQRCIIDRIVVRVNGVNILQSDLKKPRIAKEGNIFSLDEAIIEELLYQRAAEMHMLPSVLDVDRQLTGFKIQNNLTNLSDNDFQEQLSHNGFTLKMYKTQLGRLIAIENIKRAEISEKFVVTTQEVEEYYKANPEYTLDEYELATYILDADGQDITTEELSKQKDIVWENIGWVAKKDLGKQLNVVSSLKKGSIGGPISTNKTKQFVKLLDKRERRLKTFNERYGEIERYLQQERKDKFFQEFEKELKAKASLVYLSPIS